MLGRRALVGDEGGEVGREVGTRTGMVVKARAPVGGLAASMVEAKAVSYG